MGRSMRRFWIACGTFVGLGLLAVVAGIAWLGSLIQAGYRFAATPIGNARYHALLNAAKDRLRRVGAWDTHGVNADVHLVGLRESDAFGPMPVSGVDVRVVERIYLPPLTNASVSAYDLYETGIVPHGGEPSLKANLGRSLRLEDTLRGIGHWVSLPGGALPRVAGNDVRISVWRGVLVTNDGRNISRSPRFEPVPTYQVDTFSGGAWRGTFCAWNKDLSLVTYRFVGDVSGRIEKVPTFNVGL